MQDPVRRTFLDKRGFEALLDAKGINRDDHVVLYGGNNNWFAAYAYWYFRVYGHPKVSLMDGGRKLWELQSRDLTSDATEITPTSGYVASDPDPTIRARRDQILAEYVGAPGDTALVDVRSPAEFAGELIAPEHLPNEGAQVPGHIPGAANIPWAKAVNPDTGEFLAEYVGAPGDTALVDVRSPAEFAGELIAPEHLPNEGAQVPGHIPGAANIPWAKAVNPDTGEFLPTDTLGDLYAAAGLGPDKDVAVYCRIGERSAHSWFVLRELLGYEQVRNYDGSWTEYGSLVDVPVERGA